MHDTTLQYITQRAEQSGITLGHLRLEPINACYEIYVTYDGILDEEIELGDTLYVINVADWIAEHCAQEATIEWGATETPVDWTIEVYTAARFEGDGPIYRVTDETVGWVTCNWNAGGDPASNCDSLITGVDLLCDRHRRAYRELMKSAPREA